MIKAILNLLKPFWSVILQWGGIALGAAFIMFRARQSGKQAVERQQAMETLKGVKTREDVDKSVDAASILERKRLREKYNRD